MKTLLFIALSGLLGLTAYRPAGPLPFNGEDGAVCVALTTGFRLGCLGGVGICQIDLVPPSALTPETGRLKGRIYRSADNHLVFSISPEAVTPEDRQKCLESGQFEVPVDHRVNSDVLRAVRFDNSIYWIKAGFYPVRTNKDGNFEIIF